MADNKIASRIPPKMIVGRFKWERNKNVPHLDYRLCKKDIARFPVIEKPSIRRQVDIWWVTEQGNLPRGILAYVFIPRSLTEFRPRCADPSSRVSRRFTNRSAISFPINM